ncbi:hypothetical protein LINPERPRIM_LOCUS19451, partial [Linum perenne]
MAMTGGFLIGSSRLMFVSTGFRAVRPLLRVHEASTAGEGVDLFGCVWIELVWPAVSLNGFQALVL